MPERLFQAITSFQGDACMLDTYKSLAQNIALKERCSTISGMIDFMQGAAAGYRSRNSKVVGTEVKVEPGAQRKDYLDRMKCQMLSPALRTTRPKACPAASYRKNDGEPSGN